MNNVSILNPPFIFRHLSLNYKTTLRTFWVLSVLLIAALLIFYIFQVNVETSGRYLIQGYEKRIDEISKESQNLAINSAQINSLGKAEELLQSLNFEKVDKVYYIRVLDTQIVVSE